MLINQEELTKDDMDQFSDFQGQRKPQKNHWFLVKIWQEAALTATLKIETWAFGLKRRNSNHEEDFWVRKKSCEIFLRGFLGRIGKSSWFRRELQFSVKKPADSKSRAFLPLVVNFASFLQVQPILCVEKKPGHGLQKKTSSSLKMFGRKIRHRTNS